MSSQHGIPVKIKKEGDINARINTLKFVFWYLAAVLTLLLNGLVFRRWGNANGLTIQQRCWKSIGQR